MGWDCLQLLELRQGTGGKQSASLAKAANDEYTGASTAMHHSMPIKLFIYNNGGYLQSSKRNTRI